MAIGTAYFDASGKKESPVLVVAGFQSPIISWLRFEKDWKFCLAWYGVSELHMKNFAHSTDEFTSWKYDEPRRARFLGDLIRIMKEHLDNSFGIAVHMEDYWEVNRLYCLKEWAHPYALAGVHCIGKVKAWAIKYGYDISTIDHVFESGDEGKGELFGLSSKLLSIDPIFKPKEWSVAFQAADLIAYEHYRANLKFAGASGDEELSFRIPFISLAEIPGSADWGFVLKVHLLDACQKYGIPRRKL